MLLPLCSFAADKTPASKNTLPVCLYKIHGDKYKISKNSYINDMNLDLLFLSAIGKTKCSKGEYNEVFDYYFKLAEKGDSQAQYNLGRMYAKPFVVEKDYRKAFDLILKSAERGYAGAQFYIAQLYDYDGEIGRAIPVFPELQGKSYYNGIIEKNKETALKWYLKAGEQGNMKAQRILAHAYRYGRYSLGIEKDEKKAFDWYLKLANQGDADAQNEIGYYYLIGEVVEKNPKEAFIYYLKSAKQGNNAAQKSVAFMFAHGYGTKQDCKEAFKYYEKANNSYSLGEYYDNGKCVKRDYEKAFKYYLNAFIWGYCDNHGICPSDKESARYAIARLIKEDVNKAYKIIKEEKKEYEDNRYDYQVVRDQIEKRLKSSGGRK